MAKNKKKNILKDKQLLITIGVCVFVFLPMIMQLWKLARKAGKIQRKLKEFLEELS